MRRGNHRSKTGETLGNTDTSCYRPDLDSKRRKRVTFAGVDDQSPSNDNPEGHAGRTVEAKTSEYAFFKKLKSDANLRFGSKLHNNVVQNSKMFKSNVRTQGSNDRDKDGHKGFSFSTPVGTAGGSEKDLKQSSPAFRDKNLRPGDNSTRHGGIANPTGDVFSMKRNRLLQWVRDIWFPDATELGSSGCDLVPVLLTRLFPEAEDKHISKIRRKEKADSVEKPKFLDSAGSKFLNRSHKCYMEVEQRPPHTENGRSIIWLGWPEASIAPALQFPTAHGHNSFNLRDPEEISFSISYPKGGSFYRPPFLKQKSLVSCSDEGNLSCYPISSPRFRNYKLLSPIYHREEDGYNRHGRLPHELEEPTLLLEWDPLSRRNTDDLPLSYHTKLITLPNASTSSGDDHPWHFDDASHDLSTKEPCSLPLIPHNSADSFFFPITNPTGRFGEEPGRPVIGDENAVSRMNLHTVHGINSSNGLTRDTGYYHQLPHSQVEHYPYAYQTMCLPFSSSGDAYMLEAPRRTDAFRPHDWSQGLD